MKTSSSINPTLFFQTKLGEYLLWQFPGIVTLVRLGIDFYKPLGEHLIRCGHGVVLVPGGAVPLK